jgi:predicted secreted hydrolase
MATLSRAWSVRAPWLAVLAALLLCAWWLAAPAASLVPDAVPRISAVEALAADPGEERFERALAPRPLAFPADHGAHPTFRTEWWYFTGNLASPGGRRFGFQLTFFRTALAPEPPERASALAARSVWMAHFALSDVAAGRFHAAERFSRDALGLAGAAASPPAVWVQSWSARAAGASFLPLELRAADGETALELTLDEGPLVLQGDAGFSRKGSAPGSASYYYSYPRLPVRGHVQVDGERSAVEGLAWMDHEWSTSVLAPDQVGWDWFGLQLADGRALMVYQLRRADGSHDPHGSGSLLAADGSARTLAASEFTIEPRARWTSPATGIEYPARWRITVPVEGIELDVRPVLADQELRLAVVYWEGAVTAGDAGRGYAELVGYFGRILSDPPEEIRVR